MLRPTVLLVIIILVSAFGGSSESDGEHLELIFSNRVTLIKLDLETPSNYEVIVHNQSNAVAVDYDFDRKLVVWSDVRSKGIYSANINTGEAKKIIAKEDVVTPDGLAVDWVHGNVYWTDTGTNTISVASLDGEMRKLLFREDLDEPRAIVLDPLEGWMYWTDWGRSPKIERSGMDGSHRSTIVSTGIAVPNGLAIDFESRRLYWADVQHHALRSINYDGSDVKEILYSFSRLGHPFAVDVFQDWLYWTDWRSHSLSKVNKVTGQNVSTVTTRSHFFPMGLKVYHRAKQPKGTKYCGEKNAECLYLCLPAPKGTGATKNFTCACPDEVDCTNTDTVTEKPTTTFPYSTTVRSSTSTTASTFTTTTTKSVTGAPSQSELQDTYTFEKILREIQESVNYNGRISGIIFGIFIIVIIVISLVGFCVYKESLRGKIASLSFVNPVYRKQREDQDKIEAGRIGHL